MAVPTDSQIRQLAARAAGRPAVAKTAIVAGAAADTNIAIAGIKTNDILTAVYEHMDTGEVAGPVIVDRLATTSITSDGNIQCSAATNTTANRRLVVEYLSV